MKSAVYYIHKPGQLNHLKQEEIYVAHKYDDLAASIIQHVGGKDNIHNLAHCFTRLRFTLKDETKVNQEALRKTQGVIQLVMAGGQCQVVVGSKVDALYDLIRQTCGLGEDSLDGGDEGSRQHNPINALMNTVSGVLAPTLGILTAAGIIKGLISLFASLGWVSTASGVYMLLYAVGDGFFYFLPILLGFSAARRFKCSEYLGAAIGTALVYPAMVNIGSTLEVAGTFWSDKRILRDNLALTEEILAGQDAAVPLQMMGVSGFAGRPQEHPGKFGNIFYAAARDASW